MRSPLKIAASGKATYDLRRQSVLIPFPNGRGGALVVEVSRAQWLRLQADVEYAFDRMAHDGKVNDAIRDIDAQERLTMVGERQRGGA